MGHNFPWNSSFNATLRNRKKSSTLLRHFYSPSQLARLDSTIKKSGILSLAIMELDMEFRFPKLTSDLLVILRGSRTEPEPQPDLFTALAPLADLYFLLQISWGDTTRSRKGHSDDIEY